MKLTEYYKLLKENEDKLSIIEAIMELHPGYGTEVGWSWYQGGMRDTGAWKPEVLLTVPIYTLQRQLEIWKNPKQLDEDASPVDLANW